MDRESDQRTDCCPRGVRTGTRTRRSSRGRRPERPTEPSSDTSRIQLYYVKYIGGSRTVFIGGGCLKFGVFSLTIPKAGDSLDYRLRFLIPKVPNGGSLVRVPRLRRHFRIPLSGGSPQSPPLCALPLGFYGLLS
jgi:hypothetical protein